nr:acyltransferase [uncultured Paraprevotella sp.]
MNKFCKFFSHTKTGSDIIIGDDVAIAMGVTLTTHTHQISSGKRRAERKTVFRPIVIGDGCWIGANVTILPGVTIGRGTVVGAGSVVVKDLDANSVYVGNPARKIRQLEG